MYGYDDDYNDVIPVAGQTGEKHATEYPDERDLLLEFLEPVSPTDEVKVHDDRVLPEGSVVFPGGAGHQRCISIGQVIVIILVFTNGPHQA